jgi:hypothetical protein
MTLRFGDVLGDKMFRLTYGIQASLTPDLLRPGYREYVRQHPDAHRFTGHCYVACEALWHLGAREAGYRPFVAKVNGRTHWWLVRDKGGAILDPTYQQFDPATLAAFRAAGRRCGFLTTQPSKRAAKLIERALRWAQPDRV